MRRFYAGVSKINGITVHGYFSIPQRAAIVALNIGDYDSGMVSTDSGQSGDGVFINLTDFQGGDKNEYQE